MKTKKCTKIVDKEECETNKKCTYNEENKEAKCRKRPTKKIEKPISKKNSSMKSFASSLSSRKRASSPVVKKNDKTPEVEKESIEHSATPVHIEVEKESSEHLATPVFSEDENEWFRAGLKTPSDNSATPVHIEVEKESSEHLATPVHIEVEKESSKHLDVLKKSFDPECTMEKPCDTIKVIDQQIKMLSNDKKIFQHCCNLEKYWSIEEQPKTLMELMKKIIRKKIDSCDELFSKFPDSSERTGKNLTKSYIFEGLWKIIFLLKLDDLIPQEITRHFKLKIQNNENIEVWTYLNENINSGSGTGVCDLYFTVSKKTESKKVENACEEGFAPNIGDAYLFTSKYYKREMGLGKYDYEKIITEAIEKYRPHHKSGGASETKTDTFKIITLINNKDEFIKSLRRKTDRSVKKYVFDERNVYGYDDLNMVYYKKLYHWLDKNFGENPEYIDNEEKWESAIGKSAEPNILDILRFHQQYFVDCTCELLKGKTHGKVIWGAVARSGKSFMIGGLVAKRMPDVVILLLGAVGETKSQFIDELFQKYSELSKYEIIDVQANSENINSRGGKCVVVISQEKLRGDLIKMTEKSKKFIKSLNEIMKIENKIIFFDEIHQGGGESSHQMDTIKYLYDVKFPEPILIMVTATYTKPMIKYSDGLGSGPAHLIDWSYDMIMKMKSFSKSMITITESDNENMLINREDPLFEMKMQTLQKITELYNSLGKSDETIATEYGLYPELKYLIPSIEHPEIQLSKDMNINNLWELNKDTFKYKVGISKYLDYIYETVYEKIIHNKYNFAANGDGNTHSQLWFLPTNLKKGDSNNPSEIDDDSTFEILSRRLAECIVDNKKYTNFNVCVVHSIKKSHHADTDRIFYKCITHDNVKTCIRDIESKGKSLIILTGKRLRLGISLSCVDVAIHMDPIKSYDILYQSMFRVLTERKGKTNGYFVDMIADRAIRFIYNYTIQSKQSNKIEKIEMRKTDVRNSLLLFDVNGIREQIGYVEDVAVRNSYDKLAREFGIDKSSSVKFNMLVNEYNLSKSETKLIDTFRDLLKNAEFEGELKHILKNIMGEKKRGKSGKPGKHMVDIQLQKVTFQSNQYAMSCADSEDPTGCEESILPAFEKVDDKTQIDIKLNAVTKMINNLFGMLCLFSENTNIDDVLSGEVDIDYERVRMCDNDDIMHYCYLALNSAEINVSNLHKTPIEKIKEQVDKQLELLRSIYGLNSEELKESMNNLYDNIKSTMKELPEKLEEEKNKFQGLDTGFCPKDFIDNEKVLEIVRKHLTPKEEEKNLFGEVFTPLELVCEMLSKLPPRVWLDKDLKWLDPANGIGNFPIVVYYKLMDSLKDVIKTPKSRSKHIIENMLYMNELNAVNVGVCRSIFKMIDPNASPNIFRGDFLEKTDFGGVSQFDIIIGNPPYNKGGIKAKTTANVNHGEEDSETIWPSFVEKSLIMLKTSQSFILFIHPGSWIGIKSQNGKMLTSKQIIYLRFYNYKQANLLFGNQSGKIPLTYYVLQNIDTKEDTTIYDNSINKDAKFNIYVANFVPGESVNLMRKLFEFTKKYGNLREKYGSGKNAKEISDKKDSSHIYPIISIANKQIKISYSKINNNKNEEKKLLLVNSSMGYPLIDKIGNMLPESSHQFVLYSNDNINELKQLQNYFYTNLLFYLINITKTSQNFFDNKLFEIVPDITKITKRENITDDFLIDLFKLTKDDLIGYENYKTSGEGRLSPETIEEFKHFKIHSEVNIQAVVRGRQTRKKIKTIKDFISKYTRTKKGGSKSHNRKTRKMK